MLQRRVKRFQSVEGGTRLPQIQQKSPPSKNYRSIDRTVQSPCQAQKQYCCSKYKQQQSQQKIRNQQMIHTDKKHFNDRFTTPNKLNEITNNKSFNKTQNSFQTKRIVCKNTEQKIKTIQNFSVDKSYKMTLKTDISRCLQSNKENVCLPSLIQQHKATIQMEKEYQQHMQQHRQSIQKVMHQPQQDFQKLRKLSKIQAQISKGQNILNSVVLIDKQMQEQVNPSQLISIDQSLFMNPGQFQQQCFQTAKKINTVVQIQQSTQPVKHSQIRKYLKHSQQKFDQLAKNYYLEYGSLQNNINSQLQDFLLTHYDQSQSCGKKELLQKLKKFQNDFVCFNESIQEDIIFLKSKFKHLLIFNV